MDEESNNILWAMLRIENKAVKNATGAVNCFV